MHGEQRNLVIIDMADNNHFQILNASRSALFYINGRRCVSTILCRSLISQGNKIWSTLLPVENLKLRR